jgi:uncharacterized protein (DUF362 family)
MRRREFMRRGAVAAPLATGMKAADFCSAAQASPASPDSERPVVAVAASNEHSLAVPAELDELLTYDQVREVVWLALDRDTSERNLRTIVTTDSWVVLKPNIVTIPTAENGDPGGWFMITAHRDGTEHWGLVTDLRVIKAVAEYLIDRIAPRRITIAEGPPWFTSGGKLKPESFLDGWHCQWEPFDNLSYVDIVHQLNGQNGTTVDIVDLNEDEPVYVTDFDPHGTGMGAFQMVTDRDPDASSSDGPSRRRGIYLPRTIMERDVLITCPVLKVHAGAGVTLCMKNFVGAVHAPAYVENPRNNLKVMIHQGNECNLMRVIADLASTINPDYAIVEGFWATEQSFGSQNGVNINHNVVIAGGDVVAAEAVSMLLMGFNPLDSDVLRRCNMKRLGEWNPDRISIEGPRIKYLYHNYIRQNGYYTARGVRSWMQLDALSGPLEAVENLEPVIGGRLKGATWRLLDGDTIMDNLPHLKSMRVQDAMRYPLPGSEEADTGDVIYLAVRAGSAIDDHCGQLLVGIVGAEFRAFLNGALVTYERAAMTYDPTPMGFLRFQAGENMLVLEVTKTAKKSEPVRFAATICDFDGDRLPGITFDPPNE